jgi:hypothetical protein
MVTAASLGERLGSLPNTHYMTLIGAVVLVVGFGIQFVGMGTEAGLTATMGLFFVVLGLLSYSLLWLLGVVESYRA